MSEKQVEKKSSKSSKRMNKIDKFFNDLISEASLSELLQQHLKGSVLCKIKNNDADYVVMFDAADIKVSKLSDLEEETDFDCTIEMSKHDFNEVIEGRLNTQIAMLSHKIEVTGSMRVAMYFFNIFQD